MVRHTAPADPAAPGILTRSDVMTTNNTTKYNQTMALVAKALRLPNGQKRSRAIEKAMKAGGGCGLDRAQIFSFFGVSPIDGINGAAPRGYA